MQLYFFPSLNDLSGFIGISADNTYGPNLGSMREKNTLFKSQAKAFWKEITRLDEYEARKAKASQVIHPVLRVSLRIIANYVFPQEDISRAGKMELEILWCMVTDLKRPHFGAFLAFKLFKVSTSDSDPIHCGGIITYLATRLTCAKLFESKHMNLENITQGSNTITSNVLTTSSFFRRGSDGTFTWLVQGEPHFRVPVGDFSSLQLQQDIFQTRWCLPNNIYVDSIPCAPEPIPSAPEQMVVDHEDDTHANPSVPPTHYTPPTVRDPLMLPLWRPHVTSTPIERLNTMTHT